MSSRGFAWLGAVAIAIALLSSVDLAVAGQAPAAWTVPRTAGGQPDLQGVWSNNSVTPLERPDAFAGKAVLTDLELAELKRRAADILNGAQAGDVIGDRLVQEALNDPNLRPFDPQTGNYNTFWLADRDFDNRTSLIVDPPDGKLPPLTADAQRRRKEGRQRPAGGPRGPEDLGLSERCLTYGAPNILAGYNSYFQILQTPTHVVILQELIHDARVIPLDARPHISKQIRQWHGDSRGRWEGDTLVVETTNYSPQSSVRGATEKVRITERFTRVGPDAIRYEFTFDDPATWTRPWTAMIPLKRSNDLVYEYACHEGNYAMEGILAGARAQEKAAGAEPR